MKILHVLSTPRAEGTPNLVLDWLATGQHEQEVFVLNAQPADLTERLRAGARWYGEDLLFSGGVSKFLRIAAATRRVCRERQPDLLLCWPTGFANWVCLGARLAGVRNLLVHCGNPPNRGGKADWITRYVMWPLQWLGAKCICCSAYVRDAFRAVPGVRPSLFHSVWNCIRLDAVRDRSRIARDQQGHARPFTAVMVATLERHKDHATLLQAVPEIRTRVPGFRLRLVGDGTLRSELTSLAQKLQIEECVEFLGMRRDVPELLGQSDLFVFSTTPQEGLGTVLVEALAAGLPVIASDVPACRELLAGGQHGQLVPPGDPSALAAAIVAATRAGRTHASTTRDEYLARFTAPLMMAEYLAVARGARDTQIAS